MRTNLDSIASICVIVAAIAVGGAAFHREFTSKGPAASSPLSAVRESTFVPEWKSFIDRGIRLGKSDAKVTVVEFSDFECPFCRRFHQQLTPLMMRYGDDLAIVFIHYPLTQHRFARPTARAAECAANEDKFMPFATIAFDKQDSLGLKSWASYASEAGISDTSRFLACANSTTPVRRIEDGLALGHAIGVQGTPTVLINGWRLSPTPYDSLVEVVESILSGKTPAAGKPLEVTRRAAP